jgi:DNA-binding phage protein
MPMFFNELSTKQLKSIANAMLEEVRRRQELKDFGTPLSEMSRKQLYRTLDRNGWTSSEFKDWTKQQIIDHMREDGVF